MKIFLLPIFGALVLFLLQIGILPTTTVAVDIDVVPSSTRTTHDDSNNNNNNNMNKKQKWPWHHHKKHQDTNEAKADEIHVLPGWQDDLPSRMFAGYVDAGTKREENTTYQLHEHYFFVESENDPLKDPLVVWTNGGPGASSMFGLFLELGPFYLDGASRYTAFAQKSGIPSLFRNMYSWSKLANLLIINSPPPVGYSYCDPVGPSGDGNSCGSWNDELTAKHNAEYLTSFFQRFPKFKNNDYYITGESYAGIYVPTLVREILDHTEPIDFEEGDEEEETGDDGLTKKHKKKDPWTLKKNLKGFAVGDGCMGTKNVCGRDGPGPLLHLEFLRGHGQFSDKLYYETFQVCSKEDLVGFRTGGGDNFGPDAGIANSTCLDHLKTIEKAVGPYYAYNLFDACWYQNDLEPSHNTLTETRTYFSRVPPYNTASSRGSEQEEVSVREKFVRERVVGLQGALNDYPCGGNQAFFDWIMAPQVKKALHVDPKAAFFTGDNGVGFTYTPTEPDLMPFYQRVVNETDLRVLIYNGDVDPAINSFTAQNWTSHLGIPETEAWRPWTVDGKQYIGGYVTRYANDFDFLTIRGAGHMVPQTKAKETFEFMSKWLKKEEWSGVNTYYDSSDDNIVEATK